ncbi:DUF1541 domain-containing protein [Leuconostocaceae bacterium ESL0958]|nr:DUF1541 domain-containing protein [Leuconostocaceae bacterium ESL0958]
MQGMNYGSKMAVTALAAAGLLTATGVTRAHADDMAGMNMSNQSTQTNSNNADQNKQNTDSNMAGMNMDNQSKQANSNNADQNKQNTDSNMAGMNMDNQSKQANSNNADQNKQNTDSNMAGMNMDNQSKQANSNNADQNKQNTDSNMADMNMSGMDMSQMHMAMPTNLPKAENPKFKPGQNVTVEATHLPGMHGASGQVVAAYQTTLYQVDYQPSNGGAKVTGHKWITKDDWADKQDHQIGDQVTLTMNHMPGMYGAKATVTGMQTGTAYVINYQPTNGQPEVKNHMYVTDDELAAAPAATDQNMSGMAMNQQHAGQSSAGTSQQMQQAMGQNTTPAASAANQQSSSSANTAKQVGALPNTAHQADRQQANASAALAAGSLVFALGAGTFAVYRKQQ